MSIFPSTPALLIREYYIGRHKLLSGITRQGEGQEENGGASVKYQYNLSQAAAA
jgi:hypothetical protein